MLQLVMNLVLILGAIGFTIGGVYLLWKTIMNLEPGQFIVRLLLVVLAVLLMASLILVIDSAYSRVKITLAQTQMLSDLEEVLSEIWGRAEALVSGSEWVESSSPFSGPPEVPTQVVPQVVPEVPMDSPQQTPAPQTPTEVCRLMAVEEGLGQCLAAEWISAGIQTASAGGTTWFPRGVACNLSVKRGLGFLTRNKHWVSCPSVGVVTPVQLGSGLGKQLDRLTKSQGGSFIGTGEYPSCYICEQVEPEPQGSGGLTPATPIPPEPTPTPVEPTPEPTPTPLPEGLVVSGAPCTVVGEKKDGLLCSALCATRENPVWTMPGHCP